MRGIRVKQLRQLYQGCFHSWIAKGLEPPITWKQFKAVWTKLNRDQKKVGPKKRQLEPA